MHFRCHHISTLLREFPSGTTWLLSWQPLHGEFSKLSSVSHTNRHLSVLEIFTYYSASSRLSFISISRYFIFVNTNIIWCRQNFFVLIRCRYTVFYHPCKLAPCLPCKLHSASVSNIAHYIIFIAVFRTVRQCNLCNLRGCLSVGNITVSIRGTFSDACW